MIELASHDLCTACGACAYVCPKNCITMVENSIGVDYPILDSSNCIECKKCQKACPVITPVEFNNPQKAYAAWSNNSKERQSSASGGIAAEIYKYALDKGYKIVGAVQQSDFSVKLELSDNVQSIACFKNSKYVKSTCYDIYKQIKNELKVGKKVLCICLPCQVGALKAIFKKSTNLVLVDIVCHGGTPYNYLKQHIEYVENLTGSKCAQMSFRDPKFQTHKYHFSLYDIQGNCFYSKRTADGDTYQFGFHRSVTYRQNCYHCIFAKSRRASDLTLLDFKGLNDMAIDKFSNINVSGVIAFTDKGQEIIASLQAGNAVTFIERPIEEPFKTDPRLREHTQNNKNSILFRKLITETPNDFEGVMHKVIKFNKKNNRFEIFKRVYRRLKSLLNL